VGLSRVHVGIQMIQSIFFFASLGFLHEYVASQRTIYRTLYFIATFLYVGSDNIFFFGLVIHLIYVLLLSREAGNRNLMDLFRDIYLSPHTIFFVACPILLYLLLHYILWRNGISHGFLFRALSKTEGLSFDPIKVLDWVVRLIGPSSILVPLGLSKSIRNRAISRKVLFLTLLGVAYFVLLSLSAQRMERNHVFSLLVPIALISSSISLHDDSLYGKVLKATLYLFVVVTWVYMLSVVYCVDIGIETKENYGSTSMGVRENTAGVKTLGYLVRTDLINVSEIKAGYRECNRLGLFLDYPKGAYHYIGSRHHQRIVEDIKTKKALEDYDTFVLAYLVGVDRDGNNYIKQVVDEMNLGLIGTIRDKERVLLELYSNVEQKNAVIYRTALYNKRFDEEIGNLDLLPGRCLGRLGGHEFEWICCKHTLYREFLSGDALVAPPHDIHDTD